MPHPSPAPNPNNNAAIPVEVLPTLSCKHRAWVALYSLENPAFDRRQVLRQNDVTEADLAEHLESWMDLLRLHRQKRR